MVKVISLAKLKPEDKRIMVIDLQDLNTHQMKAIDETIKKYKIKFSIEKTMSVEDLC
jgi:hypothetical protein